jgi:hypothetical protein
MLIKTNFEVDDDYDDDVILLVMFTSLTPNLMMSRIQGYSVSPGTGSLIDNKIN